MVPESMVPEEQRERLAAAQRDLVAALVSGGPAPAGFDPVRLEATSLALRRKRSYGVAHVWPTLSVSLGKEFTPRFCAWARDRTPAGSLNDGYHFALALAESGELPALANEQLAEIKARFALQPDGSLRRRRSIAAYFIRTDRGRPRLLIGICGFLLRYG